MNKVKKAIISTLVLSSIFCISGCSNYDEKEEQTTDKIIDEKVNIEGYDINVISRPIAFKDKGFLIEKEKDKYDFIDINNNVILRDGKIIKCILEDDYSFIGKETEEQYGILSMLLDVGNNENCTMGLNNPVPKYLYNKEDNKITKEFLEEKEILDSVENMIIPVEKNNKEDGYVLLTAGEKEFISKYKTRALIIGNYSNLYSIMAIKNDKWALIDENGKLITDFIYDDVDLLNDDYSFAIKGDKKYLLDKNGKEIDMLNIEDISAPSGDKICIKVNNEWKIVDFDSVSNLDKKEE